MPLRSSLAEAEITPREPHVAAGGLGRRFFRRVVGAGCLSGNSRRCNGLYRGPGWHGKSAGRRYFMMTAGLLGRVLGQGAPVSGNGLFGSPGRRAPCGRRQVLFYIRL